jgi:UDP-glucuronate 4-epimerase
MKFLITGTAGFIGFHLANRLLAEGHEVVGIDSINDYYDINLKYGRLAYAGIAKNDIEYNKPVTSSTNGNYTFYQLLLEDKEALVSLFEKNKFDVVVNLAAQAGVRYSIINPAAYINANIVGFGNLLECCRHYNAGHLLYASSSSVYGLNDTIPFSTQDSVDHPVSLYAASKKSNELMAHVYSHLFALPTTGLRFFTVYGPWGRPDMALYLFTKAILEDKPIQVFNNGDMQRDFTYVDDIVEGIVRLAVNPPKKDKDWTVSQGDHSSSSAPYKVYNIGNNAPVRLMDFVEEIERQTGKTAEKQMMPMQPGDVAATYADVSDLIRDVDYKPATKIEDGIRQFVEWYKSFYAVG